MEVLLVGRLAARDLPGADGEAIDIRALVVGVGQLDGLEDLWRQPLPGHQRTGEVLADGAREAKVPDLQAHISRVLGEAAEEEVGRAEVAVHNGRHCQLDTAQAQRQVEDHEQAEAPGEGLCGDLVRLVGVEEGEEVSKRHVLHDQLHGRPHHDAVEMHKVAVAEAHHHCRLLLETGEALVQLRARVPLVGLLHLLDRHLHHLLPPAAQAVRAVQHEVAAEHSAVAADAHLALARQVALIEQRKVCQCQVGRQAEYTDAARWQADALAEENPVARAH
mmetsp:Transcript_16297/g.63534  ORF Transcript_16297/g.63534 Transcript_16297/m.63534 type:complete len:277 (-) Transcript_16297:198-1028(-)